jgi:hypothetical protein
LEKPSQLEVKASLFVKKSFGLTKLAKFFEGVDSHSPSIFLIFSRIDMACISLTTIPTLFELR